MKNYVCINGKKAELTAEQMKLLGVVEEPAVSMSEDGKTVKIGEYEFIVLKKNDETVELLLKGTLGEDRNFGDTCDFKTSAVKKVLDKFALEIEGLVGKDNLVEHIVDLTALDGLKDYGSVNAKMSLLTFAQAQEYVETLDEHKYDGWWWLATPWTTQKHGYKTLVSCVAPSGCMDLNIGGCNYYGVRPFCVLKSNIFVSK